MPRFRLDDSIFDMLAGTGNRDQVKQFEIVEVHSFQENFNFALSFVHFEPLIKTSLGFFEGLFDTDDPQIQKRIVNAFCDKSDLVFSCCCRSRNSCIARRISQDAEKPLLWARSFMLA